jgi:hypothetical protein
VKPEVWPCPAPDGGTTRELALCFDQARKERLLIIPALFDEGNKLRRFTVEVMRRLDAAGIDCFLPDLPGTNESLAPLAAQSAEGWTGAMLAASNHFRANRLLAIRGGGLIAPKVIPGWHYAPVKGASLLRQMLRGRIVAAREMGREETQEDLLAKGATEALDLGGYLLGSTLLADLQTLLPPNRPGIAAIDHEVIGGSPLWLRAEPDEDSEQADALAAVIAIGVSA